LSRSPTPRAKIVDDFNKQLLGGHGKISIAAAPTFLFPVVAR
jgi:hypothetical protein